MTGRRKVRRPGVLLAVALVMNCARPQPQPPAPVPFRLTLSCLGPRQALLAVGDRLSFGLGLLSGPRGDWRCGPPPDPATVQWSSSNPAVATVAPDGAVRGLTPGRAA